MEDLERLIDQLTVKASDITDFCNIVCNEEMKSDMQSLEMDVQGLVVLLDQAKHVLKQHPHTMRAMSGALYELRRQETIMKCVLDRTDAPVAQKQPQDNYLVSPNLPPLNQSSPQFNHPPSPFQTPTRPIDRNTVPQSSVKKIQWDKRTTSFQPPPPSTGKKSTPSLVVLDHFAYTITEKEFNTIPKYLRGGREQLGDLQRCIEDIICPCLIDKYTLLGKRTAELSNINHRQLQRLFKDQESYFPGHYFITEGDIARFMDSLIDKRLRNRLLMLRQLGLIKEVRKNSTACYMWMIRVEGLE